MNELASIRKRLRKALGQDVPDIIMEDKYIREMVGEYLETTAFENRRDVWEALEEAVEDRLRIWKDGRSEGLRGVQSGTRDGSREMRKAENRDGGDRSSVDVREVVGERTQAMVGAMTSLFAFIGNQIPEVKTFRDRVLPGRFLTPEEAHALMSSCATRTFSSRWFEEWGIPFVGHQAEVLDTCPHGDTFNPVDNSMTIRVHPPGLT